MMLKSYDFGQFFCEFDDFVLRNIQLGQQQTKNKNNNNNNNKKQNEILGKKLIPEQTNNQT